MPNFLLVAAMFPPVGSSGVQRPAKLAKYAARLGWTPHVLTMRRPPSQHLPIDSASAREVADLAVHRLRHLDTRLPFRALHTLGAHGLADRLERLMPIDGHLGFVPSALLEAERLLRREPFAAVLTTSYPFSAHLVGLALKRRHGLRWVADFRDPWTTNERYPEYRGETLGSRVKTAVDRVVERRLVREADHVTVVVERHREDLLRLHGLDPERVSVVYNGYDEEDFAAHPYPMRPATDRFRVTFVGRFAFDLTPDAFLAMFRRFLARCSNPRDAVFRLVGEGADWLRARPELTAGLEDHLELVGYVPHVLVADQMAQSSVLLIVFPRPWSMTGKIFEYLRSGLPVFGVACARGTEMEGMLEAAGTGRVVVDTDVEAGADALLELYSAWKRDAWPIRPDFDGVVRYSRETQARRFLELLAGSDAAVSR